MQAWPGWVWLLAVVGVVLLVLLLVGVWHP